MNLQPIPTPTPRDGALDGHLGLGLLGEAEEENGGSWGKERYEDSSSERTTLVGWRRRIWGDSES